MKNIVLVSHGELAKGMHSVVKMIAGNRKEVYSLCLEPDMDAGTFKEACSIVFASFSKDDEIVLLTDILSGSPILNALEVLKEEGRKERTIVIGGMNMPMVLDAIYKKDHIEDLNALKEELIREGRKGIQSLETF
ncbi:PTS sugar transporter subunit IIA [uncultured Faecalicoccus sp.]|uniref:PTS sugar transporter subunit IIA n=1 Tax=uncultured Faecalicoccus sp. TaxID=1971760 RepID=UPI00262AE58B|nr:PTS sugar transporter subunit IIA [uncultured Faecalicoccus sp.]